ncbi:hypothetical protein NFI96_012853 [Prochilodus magdalenae]|nr:hypothetical protein NFI96_012853 [Prochilodus magdalenae]
MCGKGMMGQWGTCSTTSSSSGGGGRFFIRDELKEVSRRVESQRSWHKCIKRHGHRGRRGHQPGWLQRRPHHQPRPRSSTTAVSLRPANVKGNRAPGMRAPRNTNQFLMHEKYQLMHMRSDSVGTDSGSDCEMDFADMDAYLGVLENARGALMDSPDLPSPPTARFGARRQLGECRGFTFFSFAEVEQEESMQYFPSEDDVMQSEDFMRKDFNAFCDALEYPHTVPADGAVGVEVEGHQVFWTCDNRPFILVLTTVPPHMDSLGVSTKTKAGLVTEDDPLPF